MTHYEVAFSKCEISITYTDFIRFLCFEVMEVVEKSSLKTLINNKNKSEFNERIFSKLTNKQKFIKYNQIYNNSL